MNLELVVTELYSFASAIGLPSVVPLSFSKVYPPFTVESYTGKMGLNNKAAVTTPGTMVPALVSTPFELILE